MSTSFLPLKLKTANENLKYTKETALEEKVFKTCKGPVVADIRGWTIYIPEIQF